MALRVVTGAGSQAGHRGPWAPNTRYEQYQTVTAPDGSLQAAKTGFTSGSAYNPANWTLAGQGLVARQLRAPGFLGLPVTASRSQRIGGTQTGQTTANSRIQHIATCAFTDLRIAFPGYAYDTVDNPAQVTLAAGIEYPLGGTIYPVFFGGQLSGKLDPGGILISDPVGIDIASGDAFYVRTFLTGTTAGWVTNYLTVAARNEGGANGGADLSKSGTITSSDNYGAYMALAILGLPTGPGPWQPVIGLIGDSVVKGYNDPAQIGFALRAINDTLPWIDAAKGAETTQTFATAASSQKRRRSLSACTHIVSGYGVNDIQGRTLAQVQADNLTIWTWFANRGQKVFALTITPRITATTDSYATTGGMTQSSGETKRTQFNDWIRDGAPINIPAVTAAATGVAPGAGIARAGMPGHPLYSFFDTGAPVEVNASNVQTINGGFWKVDGTANKYTDDGLHPTTASHVLMAAAFDITKFV